MIFATPSYRAGGHLIPSYKTDKDGREAVATFAKSLLFAQLPQAETAQESLAPEAPPPPEDKPAWMTEEEWADFQKNRTAQE